MTTDVKIQNALSDLSIQITQCGNLTNIRNLSVPGLKRITKVATFTKDPTSSMTVSNWNVTENDEDIFRDNHVTRLTLQGTTGYIRKCMDKTGVVRGVMLVTRMIISDTTVIEVCYLFYPESYDLGLYVTGAQINESRQFITRQTGWLLDLLMGNQEPTIELSMEFYVSKNAKFNMKDVDLDMQAMHLTTTPYGAFVVAELYCIGRVTDTDLGIVDQPIVKLRVWNLTDVEGHSLKDSYAAELCELLKDNGFTYIATNVKPEVTGDVYEALIKGTKLEEPEKPTVMDTCVPFWTKIANWFHF